MTLGGFIALVVVVALAWCSSLDVMDQKARKRRWHR
jgi:hypothetical protein